ncbi:MAG: UDP-glucose 4-epimerase GalE [Flavobacteriales bacterium]|nr:UDP-glucose 4-epimerase GalE [Flavobacteriales bacterium]
MKKPTIIVTGGAGFIGSHTVVELNQSGFRPVIVDNFSNSEPFILDRIAELCGEKIESYTIDCTKEEDFERVFSNEKPDGVIHFAAFKAVGESVNEPLKYYHNNIGSLVVLLNLMEKHGVRNLVFSSSCTVYGQPHQVPVTESSPAKNSQSPYGFTKVVCEQMINDVHESGSHLSAVLLRYFNPIGAHPSGKLGELPRGIPNNLVPYITQTAAGLRSSLTIHGNDYSTSDGTCIRDYIHVVDLAQAHIAALNWITKSEEATVEVFNVGTGNGNSVLEVVNTFQDVADQSLNYSIGPRRSGDVEQIWASTEKAEKILGWRPSLSLKDALRDAWNWQQKLK